MSYHWGGYKELVLPVERETPGVYQSLKSDLVIIRLDLTSQMIVCVVARSNCRVTGARKII